MKHTKQMIMIPKSEYETLMSMVKGDDALATERAQTDAELKRVLNDPKLSEDLRAKKYNWLYKKRRQLKREIENRPTKVVIENTGATKSAPPYVDTGNTSQKPTAATVQQEETEYTTALTSAGEEAVGTSRVKKRAAKDSAKKLPLSPFKSVVSKKFADKLHDYVANNLEKFRIYDDGHFETNVRGRKVRESDYRTVLDYMTGQRESPTKGFKFLFERLSKDDTIKKMIQASKNSLSSSLESESDSGANNRSTDSRTRSSSNSDQMGSGHRGRKKKRVRVLVNHGPPQNIKKQKFMPRIWERL